MSVVDIAQLASAIAAVGALVAAVAQINGLRKDGLDRRAAEISGVAVDTIVVHRPISAEYPNGRSLWKYQFTVHNPGNLPISNVEVRIDFPLEVQRLHYEGSVDDPTDHLEMTTPVIPANAVKSWNRSVLVDHAERKSLRGTVARVAFHTPDAGAWTTSWPATATARPDARLRQRLGTGRRSPLN